MNHDTYNQVKETGFLKNTLPGLVKALLLALGVTAAVFLIAALLLTYTSLSEGTVPFIAIAAAVLGVLLGGAAFAKVSGRRGYLSGAAVGLFYALVLYVAACAVSGSASACGAYIFILAAIGLFGGAFGGILGINTGARRR